MKITKTLTTAIAISMFSSVITPTVNATPRKVNGIAAIANGRVVTINEVAFMLAPVRARLAIKHPRMGDTFKAELEKSKKKILGELIDRQLIIHQFNDMGAQIPEHAIKADIKRQIDRTYNGSEKKFREQLKKSNLSYTKYLQLTKDKLIGQAMRAQHFNDPAPATEAELIAEYNNSEDAYAEQGGKQTNVKRTDLRPDVSFALFTEPIGTVIGPIQLDAKGFQIIRVTRKIDGPSPGLDKVREQMEQAVQNRKSSVGFNRYLDRLRSKAIIKYK